MSYREETLKEESKFVLFQPGLPLLVTRSP